jgi:beta-lactam-binding protein with PASTA domain
VTLGGRMRWIATIAVLVAGLCLGVVGCGGGGGGKKVPDVKGKSLVDAAKKLSEAQYLVDFTIVRGEPPRHKVLGQDPEGGSEAKAGTKVRLEVSDGVKK